MPVKNNPLAPFIKRNFLKSPLERGGVVWYAMIQTLKFLNVNLGKYEDMKKFLALVFP